MSTKLKTLCAATMLAALTACGGGGGGDDDAPGQGRDVVVIDPAGTLQEGVAPGSYPASTVAQSVFDALNLLRGKAGAGELKQSAELDTAAAAHAAYLTVNISSIGLWHDEEQGRPNYYATTVGARISKAGFSPNFTTETIGGVGPTLQGAGCVYGLLNTVYHGAAVLSRATHVGIGIGEDGAGIPMCVIDFATNSNDAHGQVPGAGKMIAYPYDGQTDVMETFWVDSEVPRPSSTLFPNTTAGTPVLVNVRNADYINLDASGKLAVEVTKFELKDGLGNLVPVGILANPRISGKGVTLHADSKLDDGYVVLVPLYPLSKGATYSVDFSATLKPGAPAVAKTWSFTTNP